LLGACESARAWRSEYDYGLRYRQQVKELTQGRRSRDVAKTFRAASVELRRNALALNLWTFPAMQKAGLMIDTGKRQGEPAEAWYLDPAFPGIPEVTQMLAEVLNELAVQVEARHRDPTQEFLRLGNLVQAGSNFHLPKMPNTGLAIELVHMLTDMAI